jgi:glycosyltransferase involved in cell wall biosynthesis
VLTVDADPLLELRVAGNPMRGLAAWMAAWEARLTHRLAARIICCSEAGKEHLMAAWQVDPAKVAVIPYAADVGLFTRSCDPQAARGRLGLRDEPVIMFVGSFQPWHGIEGLATCFAQVRATFPEARLVLVGDGPARGSVERRVAQLGIAHAVTFTGSVPHGEVAELLAAADVAAVPYPQLPQESWFSPLKLYEYMAAGKAIVASRSGQIAGVVQHDKTGLLVEPGDLDGFARAVVGLLGDPAKRRSLGDNARQQAVTRHSWKRYIEQLEDVYASVL